jgi:aryl-alcohol dehydrogenase-like predicted oxidoreductase
VEKGRFVNNPIYRSIFWNDIVVDNTNHMSADIALRWLRNNSKLRTGDAIIIGSSSEKQLANNIDSLQNKSLLTVSELNYIDSFYEIAKRFQPNYFY